MAYHMLESFPTSSSPNVCPNMDTKKAKHAWPLDPLTIQYSSHRIRTYSSHWSAMILWSNTLEKNMWTIF